MSTKARQWDPMRGYAHAACTLRQNCRYAWGAVGGRHPTLPSAMRGQKAKT